MTEIVFWVEKDLESGYIARSLTESIFTQAEDLETLRVMVRDAVHCHFSDELTRPIDFRNEPKNLLDSE